VGIAHFEAIGCFLLLRVSHRPEDGAKERQIVESITAKQQAQGPGSSGDSAKGVTVICVPVLHDSVSLVCWIYSHSVVLAY